ncbi:MAG: ligand-binding sensor domain-containing protein [Planctomycetota bacterium]
MRPLRKAAFCFLLLPAVLLASCTAGGSEPPPAFPTWGALYGVSPVVDVIHSPGYSVTFALTKETGFRYYDGSGWNHYLTHNAYLRSNNGRALAVSQNGIVWIGTDLGISLFDGTGFLDVTVASTGGGLVSNNVLSLFCDSQDGMWVGTDAGVSLYDPNVPGWGTVTTGLASLTVTAIGEDGAGNIWFGHDGAGLTRMRTGGFDIFDTGNGMSNGDVRAIVFDASQDGWFATAGGLHQYNGTAFNVHNTGTGMPSNDVRDVMVDGVQDIWAATAAGVAVYSGSWTVYPATPGGLLSSDTHSLALEGSTVWIGTALGLNHLQLPSGWTQYSLSNTSLPSNQVHDVVVNAPGHTWFATDGGVTRFTGPAWTTWDTSNSPLASNPVYRILPDANAIWLATDTGLYWFDGAGWTTTNQGPGGLPSDQVRDLALRADTGDLWIATAGGACRRDSGGTFTSFHMADGLGSDDVRAVAVDANGEVWAATAGGLSRFDGSAWTNLSTATTPSLPSDLLTAVAPATGGVWVGTESAGIAFFDGSGFTVHDASQGKLPSDVVRGILATGDQVFVATPAGMARFTGTGWLIYTEVNTPILSDDLNAVRVMGNGDLYICTRGAGVSVLRLP